MVREGIKYKEKEGREGLRERGKLFQYTITEPNYKSWVHKRYHAYEHMHYADIRVRVYYLSSTVVIGYEIMEGHNPVA